MSDMGHDMDSGGHGGHDMSAMMGMDHGNIDHGAHGAGDSAGKAPKHPASERNNPLVDMQSSATEPKLDDPGIGLREQDVRGDCGLDGFAERRGNLGARGQGGEIADRLAGQPLEAGERGGGRVAVRQADAARDEVQQHRAVPPPHFQLTDHPVGLVGLEEHHGAGVERRAHVQVFVVVNVEHSGVAPRDESARISFVHFILFTHSRCSV
mgnify:CR=1 FL=1